MRRTRPASVSALQHVVDGLLGHLAELGAHDADDRLRVGVRMLVHRGQHRDARTRDAQGGPAQHPLEFRDRRHASSVPQILETFQKTDVESMA